MVFAKAATQEELLQAQPQSLAMDIPPIDRLALRLNAVSSIEQDVQRLPKRWLLPAKGGCRDRAVFSGVSGSIVIESIKFLLGANGTAYALPAVMMRGMITERDFEECECAFPGIARYYANLKVKPETFLELVWGYMHRECACAEPVPVASRPAIPVPIR